MNDRPPPAPTTTPARSPERVEWPTVAVAVTIVAGFGVIVGLHDRLPAVLTIGGLAVLAAWYGSLRHEVAHGHPTPWANVNTAIATVPLDLVTPFWYYRETHLRHHRTDDLTHPLADPESRYVSVDAWNSMPAAGRLVLCANTTLAGRLVLGPIVMSGLIAGDLRRRGAGGRDRAAIARFVAIDLALLVGVGLTGLPVWQFVVGAAYLGTSLTLVRSFAEHRAVADGERTAVVRGRGAWALLFLNNNLHVTHHRSPATPWYGLPTIHRAGDDDEIAAAGAGLYAGYGEIFRRYLFRPIGPAVDPLGRVATSPDETVGRQLGIATA